MKEKAETEGRRKINLCFKKKKKKKERRKKEKQNKKIKVISLASECSNDFAVPLEMESIESTKAQDSAESPFNTISVFATESDRLIQVTDV